MTQAEAEIAPRLHPVSPSKLLAWLDCPRRYRLQYLDRPKPAARPQRAHTSVGVATHGALRDFWDLAPVDRSPAAAAELVRKAWIDFGFRDTDQSQRWRERTQGQVKAYLSGVDPHAAPLGVERTVALKTPTLAITGRVDRLDERGDELVVVDYKTTRLPPNHEDARTSMPLALYAVAVARMFRRACARVELHHLPSGAVLVHEHTPQSLERKVAQAESIGLDLRRAHDDYRDVGVESTRFAPRTSQLCTWCDYRAHCPEGRSMGPEKSSWAALEGEC
jgi:RecB family exonuclease